MSLAIIVLAAGAGTRMKSSLPKVLHPICGEPMIHYVVTTTEYLHPERTITVIGHKADTVKGSLKGTEFVVQDQQLGTGHAVAVAEGMLEGFTGTVMVLSGDTPLVREETLRALYTKHRESGAAATILTVHIDNPAGYGRIIRAEDGTVSAIIEEKDASDEQRAIAEVNTGTYCFDKAKLFAALKQVGSDNAQGEYYLTDVVAILRATGETIAASVAGDPGEVMGVNTRVQLAEADAIMRRRINERLMLDGVTIVDPAITYISPGVTIGRDSVVYPMTSVSGATTIGEGCVIGPSSRVIDCTIGDRVTIESSVVRESTIEDGAELGPFCHVRPGTLVKAGAKVGGFVEIKKSEIGAGSKVPHLSYIGDTHIGEYVNIGAGTITCNYDGANKYRTVIEDGAFVGSDTMLVAPVKVGKGSFTAAGSVITKDVPADSLSVERSEQVIIDNWAKKRKKKKDISND